MEPSPARADVSVPGFTDHHAHLLKDAAGIAIPAAAGPVRAFHRQVARARSTPMDVPDPALPEAGLVEITEMGARDWRYLEALADLQETGPLPARVRVFLASGLAAEATMPQLAARRAACAGPWVSVEGVKFYADGWLGPRTCAVCRDFADVPEQGVLFLDGPALARRIAPLARAGWRIATHAIGDRAVAAVLDGYELAWDGDLRAMAAARPRIEHASLLSAGLMDRMAAAGTAACIQPSFAVTDAAQVRLALPPDRQDLAYPWTALRAAGVEVLAGSDYPIEVLEPLVGLARLTSGSSQRAGFGSPGAAPPRSRLDPAAAFAAMTDAAAGRTRLTADPRQAAPGQIDQIEVTGAEVTPF